MVTQRGLVLPNENRTQDKLWPGLPAGSPEPGFLCHKHTEKTASAEPMSSLTW